MLGPILTKLFGSKGKDVATGIADIADRFIRTKDEKAQFEKEMAELLSNKELAEQQNTTDRWGLDMGSDSWLSKNVRPLTLIYLTIAMTIIIVLDSALAGFVVAAAWIALIQALMMVVYGAYFGFRSLDKYISTMRGKEKWSK